MPSPLSVRELGPWVLGYALLGVGPRLLLPSLPAEFLADPVSASANRTVTIRDVFLWLPNAMAGAAAVTLAVGLAFGLLHACTARVGPLFRAVQAVRYGASVAGILLIVACIVLAWVAVVGGDALDWIDLIIAGVAVGTGLATGAAYYTD